LKTSVVHIGAAAFGGGAAVVIGGPCSVEGEEQIVATAQAVKASGAQVLRGGAYKPRTSPYDFQGLGEEGVRLLALARAVTGLPFITEVLDVRDLDLVAKDADAIQIGARSMQSFSLLKECGQVGKPVMVKRGPSASIREWLLAAEYVMAAGNPDVILCERGIKGFDSEHTRNVQDIGALVVAKLESHLPVVADPSHATGRSELVPPLARAALAAGADGLMVEVHPNPAEAWSDGRQSLTFAQFEAMMRSIAPVSARA
jgi:3-deoxy-7-phosphoheptulonate synthase